MSVSAEKPYAAVFLDRDGVINEEDGIVRSPDQLRLIQGSAEAIARLNGREIPVIVITNQPVVARGWATEEEVGGIHDRLRELLKDHGAILDAVYFCPHHEEANDPAYRIVCECRKPRAGMLLKAAEEFGLELRDCVMVGDRTVDLMAAREAGCDAFLVRTGFAGQDGKCEVEPDREFEDLAAAVECIERCLNKEE